MSKYIDMTNEEIWEMLEPKMEKNGLNGIHMGRIPCSSYLDFNLIKWYKEDDVHNAIALAYKVGYLRAIKGRPFKFNEKKKKEPMEYQSLAFKGKDGKWHLAPQPNLLDNLSFMKKKSGHWEPVDPKNLPEEGTKVRYSRKCGKYKDNIIKIGDTGTVVFEGMFTPLWFGMKPDKLRSDCTWFDFSEGDENCLDMWVEDDE